jgi:monothiol glutaredoxin
MSDVMESIKSDLKSHKVMLYMKGSPDYPQCGFSARVVDILNGLGVKYGYRDVLSEPGLRDSIKQFSNWPTLPQLYINGEFVGGCDIVSEMHQKGELAPLVR